MTTRASGKAWEYALAKALSVVTGTRLDSNPSSKKASSSYRASSQMAKLDVAAREAAMILTAYDARFQKAKSLHIQADRQRKRDDPRDVVARLCAEEIGICAKHHHYALRSSRLSGSIDFGKSWGGIPVSQEYWRGTRPIFRRLAALRDSDLRFKDLANKDEEVYAPILDAFEDEFRRLCESHGARFIEPVFRYLVGKHDFYKVVRDRTSVRVQSFNINGTLPWGPKWKIPDSVDFIRRKQGSATTLIVAFADGWQVSFRLHNASLKVEPSLKFDIKFSGLPVDMENHEIPLN